MSEKKIYTIQIGFGNKIYSESKEEMIKLWDTLQDGTFKRLHSEHDWDDNEKFYWPGDLKLQLESKIVYLHEDEAKAIKAKKAHKLAKKVGIIQSKKLKDNG